MLLVIVFHAGFGWMSGGYVGVSVFFTLSGFLITSLLMVEHDTTGRIAVGAFFGRRLKRLMPAGLVCLGVVTVAHLNGSFESVIDLRSDLLGAVTHVFNWVRIAGDTSYVDGFAGAPALTSPVEHYWSLAIEEQFYLVWPVVMIALLGMSGRRRDGAAQAGRWLIVAFVVAAAVAPILALILGTDFAYWSTATRLAELLAGAALSAVLFKRRLAAWVGRIAMPALVVIIVAAVLFPSGSGPAYTGLMGLFALTTVALIAGLQVESPVRAALSWTPLVSLGRVSYGVYLFHWPTFVWLRQRGWDLTTSTGWAVAMTAVLVAAAVSHRFVERPIRRSRAHPGRAIPIAMSAMAIAFVAIALAPFPRGFLQADEAAFAEASADPGPNGLVSLVPLDPSAPIGASSPATVTATAPAPTPTARSIPAPPAAPTATVIAAPAPISRAAPSTRIPTVAVDVELPAPGSRPARILTVGDSTAFYIGQAFAQWTIDHPAHLRSDLVWCQGCGLMLDGTITSWDAARFVEQSRETYTRQLPLSLSTIRPDAVVMMSSINDMTNRIWSENEGVLTPFDDDYQFRMITAYRAVADTLTAAESQSERPTAGRSRDRRRTAGSVPASP